MYRRNVSVIIATFNGSKYIKKQMDSILKQSILPEEIIVCDDNSTDETVSLLKEYKKHNNIKLCVNNKQLGIIENFKKAAKLARSGNWLVFADQDDIWIPQKLERLMDEMQLIDDDITPALIYSDLTVIDKNDAIVAGSFWDRQKIRPEKITITTLLYGNVVTGCTMIINYAMAEEFFCMDDLTFLHDEWLALIAYSFGRVKFLTDKLVLYRQHESNISFSIGYKVPAFIDQIKGDVDYLFGKKKFLFHQFNLAKIFLLKYRNRLSSKQIKTIENFINQENKNYLLQRINRRIAYL
jgi:glycosyltransferase involved in cell wall biosynthesis